MDRQEFFPFRRKAIDDKASPELKYVAYLSERRIPKSNLPSTKKSGRPSKLKSIARKNHHNSLGTT